ncbi:Ku protein [Frigoribacterium sp. CFBP 13712]|uniref:non-homologous end joining protein Ku n=1 Tax=Frigoribacterium sp. CFBP 13712 TaxID=2775309 RepID=UPI001781FA9B|nr:Ku protein [Frigoribacterium sp. CFBP 13712]MBD8703238.1 Ku protein [Frigoribacterium sp. CFBP 13712]
MRSIWKGAITFGLVNVPVKLYSATEDHDVSLHQVHDADGGRIRYQRKCEICGKVVDYEHIDKAYDDGDRTVVITGDDLKSLPEEKSREIDVLEFVPSDQLDPIMFDRSYFLEPDGTSPKAYVLLRRTLEETDRTAIVHFSLRQKTRLAALRVRGDVLMLQTLLWDDEVREARFPALEKQTRISDKELDMSSSLVDSLSDDFEPADFSDDYQEELRQLIDAKLEEGESLDTDATFGEKPEDDDEGGEVIDLMEALRQSVEKNRSGGHRKPAKKPAAAEKPAASSSTSKPAAKKSPAKKQSAKKATSGSTSGGAGSAARKKPASSTSDKKAAPKKKAG